MKYVMIWLASHILNSRYIFSPGIFELKLNEIMPTRNLRKSNDRGKNRIGPNADG